MKIVAPSLLSADKTRLKEETARARNAGAAFIHLDVMDGKFVPNVSFSPSALEEILPVDGIKKDVHIMVEEPWKVGVEYGEIGADIVTFHIEACPDMETARKTAEAIRKTGTIPGVSIKPNTPVEAIFPLIEEEEVGLVLLMSVEPGKGGQAFIPESIERLKKLRQAIGERPIFLEVDGGINGETGPLCYEAGADILVAGSYLYGHDDFEERLKRLLK